MYGNKYKCTVLVQTLCNAVRFQRFQTSVQTGDQSPHPVQMTVQTLRRSWSATQYVRLFMRFNDCSGRFKLGALIQGSLSLTLSNQIHQRQNVRQNVRVCSLVNRRVRSQPERRRVVSQMLFVPTRPSRGLFCPHLFRLSVTLSRFATRCGRTVAISTPRICRKNSNVKTNRAVRFSADKYDGAEPI